MRIISKNVFNSAKQKKIEKKKFKKRINILSFTVGNLNL